jgi:hypothetical protein
MPYQSAVNVGAPLRPGAQTEALKTLADYQERFGNGQAPFDRLSDLHFARIFWLPRSESAAGSESSGSLLYAADIDGPVDPHLRELSATCGELVDAVFAHCADFPPHPDAASRLDWLQRHQLPTSAFYVNSPGRGARQIQDEARLRNALEVVLDEQRLELRGLSPAEIHARLRDFARDRDDLAFALEPPAGPPLLWRLRLVLELVMTIVLVLVLLPLLLILVVVGLLAVRRLELRDPVSTQRPSLDQVNALRAQEDHEAFNPFAAVGTVKVGVVRRVTMLTVLRAIQLAARHLFTKGSLGGVKTIHFARWVFLDQRRRMTFLSVYDGSLESYMNDFIDKVWWGLNAVFSNGQGYPRTRFLLLGGARDELAFKNYLRCHQLATQLSYSAYPGLTAINIENNAQIRSGLAAELGAAQAQRWLARL